MILFYTIAVSLFVLFLGAILVRFRQQKKKSNPIFNWVVLLIEVPRFNDKGPVAAELMFAALHGLLKETPLIQEHLSFEIVATKNGILFYVAVPEHFEQFVKSQIYAQYPQAQIKRVEDYTQRSFQGRVIAATEIVLAREDFFPIKTFPNFEVDPLASITSAAEVFSEESEAWLQLLVRPLPDLWQEEGYAYVNALREGKEILKGSLWSDLGANVGLALREIALAIVTLIPEIIQSFLNPHTTRYRSGGQLAAPGKEKVQLSAEQQAQIKGIEDKLTKLGFETALRMVAIGENIESARQQLDSLVAALKQFSTAHLNAFKPLEAVDSSAVFQDYRRRLFPWSEEKYFILNTEELASLYHLPNLSVETPNISWTKAKRVEYPLDLPIGVEPIIGETAFRDQHIPFGIKRNDRRRHMYIIGKTGTGKSTLLESMIISDILHGEGLAVFDPHGDMIETVLRYIPEERVEDVVLFDPADLNYPVALNMLELFDPDQKGIMASGLVDVFRRRFEFSWGPRLEHILRNCILTLLEIPHSTLLGIPRLLTDEAYRKYIVRLVEDPMIKRFWEVEFAGMAESRNLIAEAISPIQNRLGQFLSNVTIRNIVGQPRSTIRLDEIMNQGKILLVNISKGKIGEDNSAILGGMLISRLQFAAMTRVRIPEEERRDFFVYADEFQHFATSAFASILSEARKYRLNLILAHQYLAQLPEDVRAAVFGNVGTIISFAVGQADAELLAKEFEPVISAADLNSLEKYHIYLKLMIDLTQSPPFSARTLLPRASETNLRDLIIASSRQKYAVDRGVVENRIARWINKEFVPGADKEEIEKLRQELWYKNN